MSTPQAVWFGLFAAVTMALLIAPLYPTWQEWRHPQDAAALALTAAHSPAPQSLPGQVLLQSDSLSHKQVQATNRIVAMRGCRFQKLTAPTILLGTAVLPQVTPVPCANQAGLAQTLPQGTRWGQHGWRVDGDCRIAAASHLTGPLVVTGALWMGPDCLVEGDIKVHGDVMLAERTVVTGALMGNAQMALKDGSAVHGPLLCAGDLTLGNAVVLGQAGKPSSVCARNITARGTVMAHGSLHARHTGQVA